MLEKYNALYTYQVNEVEKNTLYMKVFNSEKEEFERILNKIGDKYSFDFERFDSYEKLDEIIR